MTLRSGYELTYAFPQPTPVILVLNVHDSRTADLLTSDRVVAEPAIPISPYRDGFGNLCHRAVAPAGRFRVTADFEIQDSGRADAIIPAAEQDLVEDLPDDTLRFLLGSRYCETDLLCNVAWELFGGTRPGYRRVQAICDFVHHHIAFDYQHASSTRTAAEAFRGRIGVCRDFAHLAVAFCRCMNIPARYCTGYLSDVGTPLPHAPGDFAAWFEAWIGGRWHLFDPRNNVPRIGRVLMARGRDACDVAIVTTFGPNNLESFRVWTDDMPASATAGSPG